VIKEGIGLTRLISLLNRFSFEAERAAMPSSMLCWSFSVSRYSYIASSSVSSGCLWARASHSDAIRSSMLLATCTVSVAWAV
jgi:hypothetical protein